MCRTASRSAAALKRITHLGIGAHQDDLEFMAFHGILECRASKDQMVWRRHLHQRLRQRARRADIRNSPTNK